MNTAFTADTIGSRHRSAITWAVTAMAVATALALLSSVTVTSAEPRGQRRPFPFEEDVRAYDRLLDRYRSGNIEGAIADLRKLLTASSGQRQITRWIDGARAANRRADLQGVLLLITEAIMAIWAADEPFPFGRLAPYLIPFQRLHVELKEMDARTPFLKTWYLLWESFRHVHANYPIPTDLDFMPAALAAFPRDSRVLLAAGSRYELAWWMALENAQRDLEREPVGVTKLLTTARDYLRRSLAADAGEGEARLRLAHVLLELNELSSVAPILSSHGWTPDGPAFEYLARLFEGDLHERKGDRAAAAAAYDRAIALVDAPQSALVAKAHLAHLDGRRTEAAQTVAPVLSGSVKGADPWWPFIRGQAWRFAAYRNAAHAQVLK